MDDVGEFAMVPRDRRRGVDDGAIRGMEYDFEMYGVRPDPVGPLINEWQAAEEEAERGEIETKLHTTLQKQFTDRLARHESEVEQLEARVRQLREQVDLRRERQEEIVNFRMQQLLREAQGLGWATDPVTTHPRRMGAGLGPFFPAY
jgi:hypothetical protein